MLDLHCHILPAVDDGPASLEEALAVARFCVEDGITHVIATPHCHRFHRLLRADILPHVARFNEALQRDGLSLTVLPGSEIQLTDPAAYQKDYEDGVYCHLGDDPRFTLLEFPWREDLYPPDAPGHIHWLLGEGTTPVLAHPERHGYFREHPERLRALTEAGAWLQITVDSLLGNHGHPAQVAGERFLASFPAAVLATDAHGVDRCSGLSVGFDFVRDRLGSARSDDLRQRADLILRHLLCGL
jgi:protein-tyrosine phosphatase